MGDLGVWVVVMLCATGVWSVISVRWLQSPSRSRLTDAHKRWVDYTSRIEGLESRLEASSHREDRARRALWEERYDAFLAGTPIHQLKKYGASGVRWGALESAGVKNLEQLFARRDELVSIEGVGGVTASRVGEALDRLHLEWRDKKVQIPTRLASRTESNAARAVLEHELYSKQVRPEFRRYKQQGPEPERPPSIGWFNIAVGLGSVSYPVSDYELFVERVASRSDGLVALEKLEREGRQDIKDNLIKRWASYTREAPSSPRATRASHEVPNAPLVRRVYETEAQFEEEFLEPLIAAWGLTTRAQHSVDVKLGSTRTTLYVDQYVSDQKGPVILIESKRAITGKRQLADAMAQARSYALQLGFPGFMVAAPEGLWLYSLSLNQEELVAHEANIEALTTEVARWRALVLEHRKPAV